MKKLKITVIEDDPDVIDYIRSGLDGLGFDFEFESITGGAEFKRDFSIMEPDIIVLDLMMPGITGFEICGYIRKNPKLINTKILAITGYDTPENRNKILNAGADGYLAKPFDLNDFIQKIKLLASGLEK